MKLRQVYTGTDGSSHIDDFGWLSSDISTAERVVRSNLPCQGVSLYDVTNTPTGLHNAPQVQLIHVMSGRLGIECGDGYREEFGPGDVLLASDLTGEGHATRILESPVRMLVVPLSDRGLSALEVQ